MFQILKRVVIQEAIMTKVGVDRVVDFDLDYKKTKNINICN